MVEDAAVVKGIVQAAKDEAADLVVIGSHGRSGLARLVLGGVASKVVAESPVPVLVTR
jgi:nucleotide-binding universal stress UspA family protein